MKRNMKKNKLAVYFRGKEINVADIIMCISLSILAVCIISESFIFEIECNGFECKDNEEIIDFVFAIYMNLFISAYLIVDQLIIPLLIPFVFSFILFISSLCLYEINKDYFENKIMKIVGYIIWIIVASSIVLFEFVLIINKPLDGIIG